MELKSSAYYQRYIQRRIKPANIWSVLNKLEAAYRFEADIYSMENYYIIGKSMPVAPIYESDWCDNSRIATAWNRFKVWLLGLTNRSDK